MNIHPDAANRAFALAIGALDGATSTVLPSRPRAAGYMPDIVIGPTITEESIRGPIISSESDGLGREISRTYADKQAVVSLTGGAYKLFARAADIIAEQPAVHSVVSRDAVLECVFEWICATKRDGPGQSLIDHVRAGLPRLVRDFEIVIPLYGLHVQSPIDCGRVHIADITSSEIDQWSSMWGTSSDEQSAADAFFKKFRKNYQGRAAARLAIAAERRHAEARAREEAELAVAVLCLVTRGAYMPEAPTPLSLLGAEVISWQHTFTIVPDVAFSSAESTRYPDESRPETLTSEFIEQGLPRMVGHWFALLRKDRHNAFEKAALRSVIIYSRATRQRNISEKLIHAFAALESLLLKSDTEPISASVGERLAFAVGHTVDERLSIAANMRHVYAMRSRYVHHAIETPPSAADLERLDMFLAHLVRFFINLGAALSQFASKDDYLRALERRKYT